MVKLQTTQTMRKWMVKARIVSRRTVKWWICMRTCSTTTKHWLRHNAMTKKKQNRKKTKKSFSTMERAFRTISSCRSVWFNYFACSHCLQSRRCSSTDTLMATTTPLRSLSMLVFHLVRWATQAATAALTSSIGVIGQLKLVYSAKERQKLRR